VALDAQLLVRGPDGVVQAEEGVAHDLDGGHPADAVLVEPDLGVVGSHLLEKFFLKVRASLKL
jgi:hypothetical protein